MNTETNQGVPAACGLGLEALQKLDRRLALLARISGSLRFQLGLALDALARRNGFIKVGFPTLKAYGLERCERGGTWIGQTRQVARKLQRLPLMLEHLRTGRLSWSMAVELVRIATPADEAEWLHQAGSLTVAQVKAMVDAAGGEESAPESDDELCVLTITANQEDAWAFEAARLTINELIGGTTSDAVDALVGEALTSLLPMVPDAAFDPDAMTIGEAAQLAYNGQREAWRKEAERLCESRIPRWPSEGTAVEVESLGESTSPEGLDRVIRRLSATLESRDYALGELGERFIAADGWRRLGYGTARQYATERLGMSISSLKAKRRLVARLRVLPAVRTAHRERRIGYEAARVASNVANPATDAAWAQRAAERTIVHLREDVSVAEMIARVRNSEVLPPDELTVNEARKLRADVVSGAVYREQVAGDESPQIAEVRKAFAAGLATPPHRR